MSELFPLIKDEGRRNSMLGEMAEVYARWWFREQYPNGYTPEGVGWKLKKKAKEFGKEFERYLYQIDIIAYPDYYGKTPKELLRIIPILYEVKYGNAKHSDSSSSQEDRFKILKRAGFDTRILRVSKDFTKITETKV